MSVKNRVTTLLAAVVLLVASGVPGPAMAVPQQAVVSTTMSTADEPNIMSDLGITEHEWKEEAERLIASDLPRTRTAVTGGIEYVFHLPLPEAVVPGGGTFDLNVFVADSGEHRLYTPRLGAGSDSRGAYFLLNNFDQNMLIGGYTTVIAMGLCAIPAVGWISCAVITAAAVAAAAWLAVNNTCPKNLKVYLFQSKNAYVCVK